MEKLPPSVTWAQQTDDIICDCIKEKIVRALGGVMFRGSHFVIAARLATLPLLLAVVSSCSSLPSGSYRFQTEFERDPMAFRGGERGEPLVVTVKLQNLSDKPILIAGKSSAEPGAYLTAAVTSSSPALGRPVVITGLRAGMQILSQSDATREVWFDRHANAVNELATVGPELLHLDADSIRSDLGLFANEAAFTVSIPVKWDAVPRDPFVIPVDVAITVRIAYVGPNGEKFVFPAPLQRRVTGYLERIPVDFTHSLHA